MIYIGSLHASRIHILYSNVSPSRVFEAHSSARCKLAILTADAPYDRPHATCPTSPRSPSATGATSPETASAKQLLQPCSASASTSLARTPSWPTRLGAGAARIHAFSSICVLCASIFYSSVHLHPISEHNCVTPAYHVVHGVLLGQVHYYFIDSVSARPNAAYRASSRTCRFSSSLAICFIVLI
jgi:hypothetical protein